MEHYVADYSVEIDGKTRSGMEVLSDVRDMQSKFEVWVQLLERLP